MPFALCPIWAKPFSSLRHLPFWSVVIHHICLPLDLSLEIREHFIPKVPMSQIFLPTIF